MSHRTKLHVRKAVYDLFYTPSSSYFYVVNDILAATTLLSVLSLVLETVPGLLQWHSLFLAVEYISVALFTLEYAGRIYARGSHYKSYVFSFFGIVDILAILPTYLGLANLTFLKTARVLRILRLLRMVRLAKIARQSQHRLMADRGTIGQQTLSTQIYFVALLSMVLVFGTLMYAAEGQRQELESIPLSMIWAAKVILGGVPQHMPETLWGEFVTIGARFAGLLLFGLLISIVGTGLQRLLFGSARISSKHVAKAPSRKR